MSPNSEQKNKVFNSIMTIFTAIIIYIINSSSMEVCGKIIYSTVFVVLLLVLLSIISAISFTRIDKKSYVFIKKDLDDIGRTLEGIKINPASISVESISKLSCFANHYYNKSTVVNFSNKYAKIKFKSLCKSLANLEDFIWDNHLDNARGVTIRISFIGSSSGVYDHNKHGEQEEENKERYRKLYKKAFNDYRSFKKYCENRL